MTTADANSWATNMPASPAASPAVPAWHEGWLLKSSIPLVMLLLLLLTGGGPAAPGR